MYILASIISSLCVATKHKQKKRHRAQRTTAEGEERRVSSYAPAENRRFKTIFPFQMYKVSLPSFHTNKTNFKHILLNILQKKKKRKHQHEHGRWESYSVEHLHLPEETFPSSSELPTCSACNSIHIEINKNTVNRSV